MLRFEKFFCNLFLFNLRQGCAMYISDWPETPYVDQVYLKLTEICLLLSAGFKCVCYHAQLFLKTI